MAEERRDLGGKLTICGKDYGIYGGINTVGRNQIGVVNLKNLSVSQYHAMFILVDDDMHFISDMKSSNGTFLNGTKLAPLQLYMIENGDNVKFANLEGQYTKCYSGDTEHSFTNSTESTQSCTQSIYATHTQVIEESLSNNPNKTQANTKKSHYISAQVLAKAANAMESTYERLHEQPTQLVDIHQVFKKPTHSQFDSEMDKSVFDLHEAETQKIILVEDNIHEAETQILPKELQKPSNNELLKSDLNDSNIASTSKINENSLISENCEANLNSNDNADLCVPNKISEEVIHPIESTKMISQNSSAGLSHSQESDIVHPIGISCNVVADSQNTTTSLNDSESDIIRPVKKSVNPFISQEITIDENDKDKETKEQGDIDESSNDSLDFMTMQKITDMEKKYLDNENLKEGTSKLNLTIENAVTNTKEEQILDHSDIHIKFENKKSTAHDEESETDNENASGNKNDVEIKQNHSDSDTDLEEYKKVIIKPGNEIKKISESDTDIEKGSHTSDTDSKIVLNKRKKKKCFKKKKNIILDSESETDIEDDKKEHDAVSKHINSNLTIPESKSNEEENSNLDKEINSKTSESGILVNSTVNSSIMDNSAFDNGPSEIDETINENNKENLYTKHLNEDNKQNSLDKNKIFNDSDIIPCTQDMFEHKTTSQNSKLSDNSESFKLGITQLMEDYDTESTSQKKNLDVDVVELSSDVVQRNLENDKFESDDRKSQNVENSETNGKKFVFKKKCNNIIQANVTLDYPEQIYAASTQNLYQSEQSEDLAADDNLFLHPGQTTVKRRSKSEKIFTEDIYEASTQKFVETPDKSVLEDIYMISTQKLTQQKTAEPGTSKMEITDDIYQQPTQKLLETEHISSKTEESHSNREEDDDLNDMFSSQITSPNTPKSRRLESQLEDMFASQRFQPAEESLDKIKAIVFQTPIVDTKLPEADSDLEAILQTQKILDSPKSSGVRYKRKDVETPPGRSVESQLEVIFASQTANLPLDKFARPSNPLVDVFEKETQLINTEPPPVDTTAPKVVEVKAAAEKPSEVSDTSINKHDTSECNTTKSSNNYQNCLEQSFALLESKSTKMKRSSRNKICEEVKVSCQKSSRLSMDFTPNKTLNQTVQKVQPVRDKSKRIARKRQNSLSSEGTTIKKNDSVVKKTRNTELLNNSDDDSHQSVSSTSSINTRTVRASKRLVKIQESDCEDFEDNSTKIKIKNTTTKTIPKSTRLAKNNEDEDKNNVKTIQTSSRNKSISLRQLELAKEDTLTKQVTSVSLNTIKKVSEENINKENRKTPVRTSRKTKKSVSTNVDDSSETNSNVSESTNNSESHNKNVEKKGRRTKNDNINTVVSNSDSSLGERTTNSSARKTKSTSVPESTPPKTRKVSEKVTPSTSRSIIQNLDTPSRNKRKQKPKVVFTMMENPHLESCIRQMGGRVVDSVDVCTVLITHSVKRSMKLLSAVGLGKPICSQKWVEASKKENQFLDPWDFILIDKEAEKKWNFSLRTSLERSSESKLFNGYTFQLMVTTALDVLKGAIESCGGKIVTRTAKGIDNFVLVASPENKGKFKKILKDLPDTVIVEPEAIFDGVLRQEIRFENHLLK